MEALLHVLLGRGHQPCVLAVSTGGAGRTVTPEGVPAELVPIPVGFSKTWTLDFLRRTYVDAASPWVRAAEEWIERLQPDVLHVNDLPLSWVACHVARSRGIPVVVDYHHEGWPEMARALAEIRGPNIPWWAERREVIRFWEELEAACFRDAAKILIVDEILEPILTGRGCPAEKLVLVRNTPQPHRLASAGRSREFPALSFDLGYVGSFDIMKDVPGLVRAFARIAREKATTMLLVGAGEQEAEVKALVSDLGVGSRVTMPGWLPPERFAELIEACRVCLIPLRLNVFTHQSSPNKVFQYMYFRRPIIVTPVRSVSRIVSESGTGFSASFGDQSFEAVLRRLEDPSVWEACASAGPRALEHYRWEDDARRLIGAFE